MVKGVQAFSSGITCKNGGVGYLFFLFSTFCSSFHPLNAMYKLNVGPHSAGFVIQKRVNGMEACINVFTEFMFPILYCIILREKHCC